MKVLFTLFFSSIDISCPIFGINKLPIVLFKLFNPKTTCLLNFSSPFQRICVLLLGFFFCNIGKAIMVSLILSDWLLIMSASIFQFALQALSIFCIIVAASDYLRTISLCARSFLLYYSNYSFVKSFLFPILTLQVSWNISIFSVIQNIKLLYLYI